jgi:hypothetical protein
VDLAKAAGAGCSVLAFNVNCASKDVQEEARVSGVSTGS